MLLVGGGSYNFVHCTLATYSNNYIQHKDPLVAITDKFNTTTNSLTANFTNCIFWAESNGIIDDEVVTSKQGSSFNVVFDHVLWRVKNNPANATITSAINNQNPLFDTINTSQKIYSFRLKDNSPAINAAKSSTVNIDLDGNPRPVGNPDLGAYEKQ